RTRVTSVGGRASRARNVIAKEVCRTEDAIGHQRTVLVGDFNMHPYEDGMVSADALHAVMSEKLSLAVSSLAPRAGCRCFYNPMWALFGDRTPGPPGTHYWDNAEEPTNHFWNIYDQVLLRPGLMKRLSRIDVLDHDGVQELVTSTGRPRKAT